MGSGAERSSKSRRTQRSTEAPKQKAGHEEDGKEETIFQAAVQGECVQVGGRGEAVTADAGEPQETDELDNDNNNKGRVAAKPRKAKEEPVRAGALVSGRQRRGADGGESGGEGRRPRTPAPPV